jgi:hypothetical protein
MVFLKAEQNQKRHGFQFNCIKIGLFGHIFLEIKKRYNYIIFSPIFGRIEYCYISNSPTIEKKNHLKNISWILTVRT